MKSYKELAFAVTAITSLRQSKTYKEIVFDFCKNNDYSEQELKEFVTDDNNYKRLAHNSEFFTPVGETFANVLRKKHRSAIQYYFGLF